MENFPWHEAGWASLNALRGRMPHAVLLHGPAGTGKRDFAEKFAKSLLCEMPAGGRACGECVSCGWFEQYSHPDYRRVRPEALEEEPASEADEDGGEKKSTKASKTPSKDIRIDQVRGLADFLNVSTHRQGFRVVLLYPADSLNSASANALLKMLEEPPANTVFILVTDSLDRLLPTILSRCRKLALTMPSREEALQWLQEQGVKDAAVHLDEEGGAPLAALAATQREDGDSIALLLNELARPSASGALKAAEALQKVPPASLVVVMQRWLYDLFSVKLVSEARYYPRYGKELGALAARVDATALAAAAKALSERRAIAEHPLSPRLFIEDMLLDYSALFS